MARGKFNKRGGGPRLDAVNAEEIEQRNARLAEYEEQRAQRRADDDEEGGGGGEDGGVDKDDIKTDDDVTEDILAEEETRPADDRAPEQGKVKKNAPPAAPVTTEYDHRRNMAKLAEVRKRREVAEAKRLAQEELERQEEDRIKQLAAQHLDEEKSGNDADKKKKKNEEVVIPTLDKIAIKRMKPAQMKEALKERDLDIQGNAKALQERLLQYENSRS